MGTHQALREVKPDNCALAVAIPLTSDEFLADLARPVQKDYATHVKNKNLKVGVDDEYYWNEKYSHIAKLIDRICDEVADLGVKVKKRAIPQDLTELWSKFSVITLVAHWRFARFLPGDILDVHSLLQLLLSPKNQIQMSVRLEFEVRCPGLLDPYRIGAMKSAPLQQKVAETMNAILLDAHKTFNLEADNLGDITQIDSELLDACLKGLNRVSIEQAFPEQLAASNAIEFSDRMYTVDEVVNVFPEDFSGFLDLTVCNSVVLGSVIKKKRPNCIIAVNRYLAEPHYRLSLYKWTIQEIARRPALFMDAATKIRAKL